MGFSAAIPSYHGVTPGNTGEEHYPQGEMHRCSHTRKIEHTRACPAWAPDPLQFGHEPACGAAAPPASVPSLAPNAGHRHLGKLTRPQRAYPASCNNKFTVDATTTAPSRYDSNACPNTARRKARRRNDVSET